MAVSVPNQQDLERWARVGTMASFALLLGYAETFIPIPVPGVKLGLANIPILAALALHDVAGACTIALVKVLATGLLFGSPLTLAYSLAGTALSLAGMVPLSYLRSMHVPMLSVVGALLHAAGQLLVASLVLGTNVVWLVSPLVLVASCATGLFCGVLSAEFADAFAATQGLRRDDALHACAAVPEPAYPGHAVVAAFVALVAGSVLVLHLWDVRWLCAAVALAVACCLAARVPGTAFLRMFRLVAGVGAVTLLMQWLVAPNTALAETGRAIARLACLTAASTAFMRLVPAQNTSGLVSWMLLPLTKAGVPTAGFLVAFDVAVRTIPAVGEAVRQEFGRSGARPTLTTLRSLLSRLVPLPTTSRPGKRQHR